jgi:hypothetical protein
MLPHGPTTSRPHCPRRRRRRRPDGGPRTRTCGQEGDSTGSARQVRWAHPSASGYRQRGLLKARMRRYDEALPNDARAFGLRALVWAKKGDRSRALADFDEAIRLAPQSSELFRPHRDRVLAATERAPIEERFILKNPFVSLCLPPTAAPATVKDMDLKGGR